jgi:hypothetical protein
MPANFPAGAEPTESLPPPLLVDASRFARELGIARRTFDRFRSEGLIPSPDVSRGGKFKRWRWATVVGTVERLSSAVA